MKGVTLLGGVFTLMGGNKGVFSIKNGASSEGRRERARTSYADGVGANGNLVVSDDRRAFRNNALFNINRPVRF